jgi:hypothetical protein
VFSSLQKRWCVFQAKAPLLSQDLLDGCEERVTMRFVPIAHAIRTRLRSIVEEGMTLFQSGLGLTKQEREGVMLVAALFVLGLAVQWLRWLLR